ncbi:MAG TPA: endonuclease/exonuclease/phosphatase family protein [Candidatus Saccharimonadia bacterium]|nr:endonuclease/exonuclease/phosphatase family protein [Candidatus Saccharimonadia bacterium]
MTPLSHHYITVLSYNLWLHRAYIELPELIEQSAADVVCLQECRTTRLAQTLGGLTLVSLDQLHQDTGLAIYVNTTRWQPDHGRRYCLQPDTWSERLLRITNSPRLQLLRLSSTAHAAAQVVIGNTHIADLAASSRSRRQQAAQAAQLMLSFAAGRPSIIVGDFNYPFGEHRLLRAVQQAGLTHVGAGTGTPLTTYQRWPKRTFDRMFTAGASTRSFAALPFGRSDHAPILGRFALGSK